MTDFAQRLRNVAREPVTDDFNANLPEGHTEVSVALLLAAADEIERLAQALAQAVVKVAAK